MPVHVPAYGPVMVKTPPLFHYTCRHGHGALQQSGVVLPAAQHSPKHVRQAALSREAWTLANLAWFTDLDHPEAWALGLTSVHIRCNRSAFRWAVDPTSEHLPIRWGRVRRAFSRPFLDALEGYPGAQPARWWVATWPVSVTYQPL